MGVIEGTTTIGIFIFSEFMSYIINEGVDQSKDWMKNVIQNKHNQSFSTKIYRVIEKTLNKITDEKYKDSDILYKAMEKIFDNFYNGYDEIEAVRSGLHLILSDITDSRCEDFIEDFYNLACQDDYLYKRISIILEQNGNKICKDGFQQINKKIDNTHKILSKSIDEIKQGVNEITQTYNGVKNSGRESANNKLKIESRTQEYANKWNENMFLNNTTEWDRKKHVNIKLSDVYIEEHLPHFFYKNEEKVLFNNIYKLLSKYILNNSDDNKMLLILGQPGIGKSTLITWIVSHFKNSDILIYQFASDLKYVDWKQYDITGEILKLLNLDYDDLSNKTIILDGFDEINIENDKRELLDKIYWKLIKEKKVNNFSLIITCRENYIHNLGKIQYEYITLSPWNEKQIKSFCEIYCNKNKSKISDNTLINIIENRSVLGVPLILYMTLALEITIEKESSIVDIYDKIFSINGGIYDRCIGYAEPHRIGEIKTQIHQISREIAFWMFENSSEKAVIPQEEYRRICKKITIDNNDNVDLEKDSIIGNFYKLKHYEGIGTNELYFVHRSIYEYFMVEYIFDSMCKAIDSSENLANVFGFFLKKGLLNNTMCKFLNHKIEKSILKNKFTIINKSFRLMSQNGMTYYTSHSSKTTYKNIIDCEMNVFANMLEILHLWNKKSFEFNRSVCQYLKYNVIHILNLKGANLRGADLRRAGLTGANLRGADLVRTNLTGADLKGANLRDADLRKADLTEANLKDVNFDNVDLNETIFDEYQITYLENKYDLSKAKVRSKEGETIYYMEYKIKSMTESELVEVLIKNTKIKSAKDLELVEALIRNNKINSAKDLELVEALIKRRYINKQK